MEMAILAANWPIQRFFVKLVIIALVFYYTFQWLGHFYTQIQVKIESLTMK